MDVHPLGGRKITICAHRWKNQNYMRSPKYADVYLLPMNGLCYEMDDSLDDRTTKLLPALVIGRRQRGTFVTGIQYPDYEFGVMGMSSEYSRDGNSLIIGAPGIVDYTGGLINITDDRANILELPFNASSFNYLGLIGYSVTTGRPYSDHQIYNIAGGPRVGEAGQVFVFQKELTSPRSILSGTQIGGYFGWSVASADLNGDTYDDVLVGSPTYFEELDEGRVFVFYSNGLGLSREADVVLTGSNAVMARFGTAIMNLGDIDNDRFQDVAVGAPYEDESRGAIYIYNGGYEKIKDKYSQKIAAKELNYMLQGFGISLSRPLDVDNNYYNDIAVGSYLSGQAVLLRTRPVVNMTATIKAADEVNIEIQNCEINGFSVPCIKAQVCFQYDGIGVPDKLTIHYKVAFDTLMTKKNYPPRGVLASGNTLTAEETRVVRKGIDRRNKCKDEYYFHVKSNKQIRNPIQIVMNYELIEGKPNSCEICPILDAKTKTKVVKKVQFTKSCGDDKDCKTDMVVDSRLFFANKKHHLVRADDEKFVLAINVMNNGEAAYDAKTVIMFPKFLRLTRTNKTHGYTEVLCGSSSQQAPDNDTTVVECEIGHPIPATHNIVFTVDFQVENKSAMNMTEFNITVTGSTSSIEKASEMDNNKKMVYVPVRIETEIGLTGTSVPDQVTLFTGKDKQQKSSIAIQHLFNIDNGRGLSDLPDGEFSFKIPAVLRDDGHQYLKIEDIQIDDSSLSHITCTSPNDVVYQVKKDGLDTSDKNEIDIVPLEKNKFSGSSQPNHYTWRCKIGEIKRQSALLITIIFSLDPDIVNYIKSHKLNSIPITTKGTFIESDNVLLISSGKQHSKSITTHIYLEKPQPEGIEPWIIAVAIACGLLVLILLILLLWKCGFFRRKKREEMYAEGYGTVEAAPMYTANMQSNSTPNGYPRDEEPEDSWLMNYRGRQDNRRDLYQ